MVIKIHRLVRKIARIIAEQCDVKLNHPWTAQGTHPLVFADSAEIYTNQIPKSVYFNTGCGAIRVGHNVVFGEDVLLLTGKHMDIEESSYNGVPLHSVPVDGRDITIGDGCYIGSGAIIIGPCRIGNFAVISAGAVVQTDVAEMTVVAGSPARAIKRLKLSDETENPGKKESV